MLSSHPTAGLNEFDRASRAFLDWFSQFEGARWSQSTQVVDLRSRDRGRGVIASRDIAEDEELFAVPRRMLLNPSNSDIPHPILQLIDSDDIWLRLTITLIYEILCGETSPWFPYLALLPTTFNTLMYWTPQELAYLKGSSVLDKIGKEEAEKQWSETIIPAMLQHPAEFPVTGDDEAAKTAELVRLAHRAATLIMAYAFDIDAPRDAPQDAEEDSLVDDGEDNPVKAMVPFADLLNAEADRNNARLFQEDEHLIMRSVRPIKSGEEIFNDYGPLPQSDLLRMYGYVSPRYSQYDVVEIEHAALVRHARVMWDLDGGDSASWNKQIERLERVDVADDGYTIANPSQASSLTEDGEPSTVSLTNAPRLQDAIDPQLSLVLFYLCGGKAGSGKEWDEDQTALGLRLPARMAVVLRKVLDEKLESYAGIPDLQERQTLRKMLEEGVNPGYDVSRALMARHVTENEMDICQRVRQLCLDYGERFNLKRKHSHPGNVSRKLSKVPDMRTSGKTGIK